MRTAGFVLAGGASSRMGKNKAFLTLGDRTMIEIVAAAVRGAAGTVSIIGAREIYSPLGFPVIPDHQANLGPLGGIETALIETTCEWNLIVACDMPRVTQASLRSILDEAEAHPHVGCILPLRGNGHIEPLYAAYNKSILPAISRALLCGIRKVTDALPQESVHHLKMSDDPVFQNINTPEEWRRAVESH